MIFPVSYYDKFSVAYDLHLFQSAMDVISNSISDPIFAVYGEALRPYGRCNKWPMSRLLGETPVSLLIY